MGTFKMIIYPFALAIVVIGLVMLLGMIAFGVRAEAWNDWQNELVSTIGTLAGFGAAATGLWLAIRSERQAF